MRKTNPNSTIEVSEESRSLAAAAADVIGMPGNFKSTQKIIQKKLLPTGQLRSIKMVDVTLEVCIDTIASGIEAEAGGASRIELCSALSEGGLTPTVGFLRTLKEKIRIPVFVMIRPRAGDFLYSADEISIMIEDMRVLRENGADGFVSGVLTKSGHIDSEACKTLLHEAKALPVTFHRAFDQLASPPEEALELLIELGFSRLLTSGQASNAKQGIPTIKNLVRQASGRIAIMAGAGISPENVAEIVSATGVTEVHASARKSRKSDIQLPTNSNVSMGSLESDFITYVTNKKTVEEIIRNANKCEK